MKVLLDKYLENACSALCKDPFIVEREMSAYCVGNNAVFPFAHAVPTEDNICDVFIKTCQGLDLCDLTAKWKAATAMSTALWKLPHLVKNEIIAEARPKFEFVHPTIDEFELAYKQVSGGHVPGRNEIATMAAAIDKTLMKLAGIGPLETRGRLLKHKFYESLDKLRGLKVIDYSDATWDDHNPTWDEWLAAYEGPGADNIDRTVAFLKTASQVLKRETLAKEAMFWNCAFTSVIQDVKISPNKLKFIEPTESDIRRIFLSKGEVPIVEALTLMPSYSSLKDSLCQVKDKRDLRLASIVEGDRLQSLLTSLAKSVVADKKVWSEEEAERFKFFWDTYNVFSEDMSKKTGKKYYISERPSSAEILDVLDSAVERGLERNGRIVIESYYAHRRSNFIKGYADPELFARVLKRKYNYVMTSKAPGWYDVCMPYKACIVAGTVCVDGIAAEDGCAGMMIECIGIDYLSTTQVATRPDGSFKVTAQRDCKVNIKVISEFAEEEFGPYTTDEFAVMNFIGRVNLVRPKNAWPTVLKPKR